MKQPLKIKSSALFTRCKAGARRAAALVLSVALALPLSACWSRRELNTLAIVVGTALDAGEYPDTLKLTVQVVKAAAIGSGPPSNGGSGEKAYVNISYTDKSVLSAVRSVTHMQNRTLYFSHNEVLIFGSDLAKLDMAKGLDAFTREYESRLNVYILIAKGNAADILQEDVELEKTPALHISGMMENQKTNSETAVVTLRDFCIATLSPSRAPVAPIVELYEADGKKYARLNGTAVFKQGKMVSELDIDQTRGLLLATNKASSAATTIETDWGQVGLEIDESTSSLKPIKAEDGSIKMKLTINVSGSIQSNETDEVMSSLENVDMLKEKMREHIRADVENVLQKARELSADVFGFGDAIRRDYPKEWNDMKGIWEEIFPNIRLDIEIDVKLRSTGGLSKPVIPGGAK